MTLTENRVPSIASIASDKDRVNALYAPLRPREANPEHYDRKMKFWVKAVSEYCAHCRRVSFTLKELQKEFRVEGKSPSCLNEVINEVIRNGTVVSERDFYENLKSAESWKAWSQTSALRVLRKVGSYVPSPISYFYRPSDDEIRFVNVDQLKDLMEQILSESCVTNKLINVVHWKSKVKELTKLSDPIDIDYLLGYLKARKCVIMDKVGSEDVIIMSADVGTMPTISDVEKGKYDIARTKEILEKQLSDITEKKTQAEEKARANLKQGLRSSAKHELRRKKLLEQRMDKLLTMVDNLSVLECQIEDAESDAVLISAYENGKKALTGVLADKRLNSDHVTETMLDIQELLDQHSDITSALAQPMDNQDPDMAALEDELEDLLKEDQQKSEIVKPSPLPRSTLTKEEEDEVLKSLEALELDVDGLDDFSKSVPSPSGKMDKSGDSI